MPRLIMVILIVVADQITKVLAMSRIGLHDRIPIIPGFFNLTYVQNTGAAFGMFSGNNVWLALLSLVMLVLILTCSRAFFPPGRLFAIAKACLIAGIIGNCLDRVRYSYVVDFLDFYIGESHFPSFNIADSAICIGVGLYLIGNVRAAKAEAAAAVDDVSGEAGTG